MIGTLLPFVASQWFTDAGDAVLSGGSLEFYEVGTTTPKAVYADYQNLTPIGSVVTLNGAGKATIFLGSGGYKVILKDALGATLDTKDGIFGSGETGSGAITDGIETYDDLRALPVPAGDSIVRVIGALVSGDGAEGLFKWDSVSSEDDDGGIVICPTGHTTAGRWVRVVVGIPSIRWWGIHAEIGYYDDAAVAAAFGWCGFNRSDLLIDKRGIIIQTSKTFSGGSLRFMDGSFAISSSIVYINLTDGAVVSGNRKDVLITGGGNFRFGPGQRYSSVWCGSDTTGAGITKAVAAGSTNGGTMEIGQNYVVVTPVAVPKNISVAHGGGIITVNSGGTLSIDSFDDSNFTGSQMFAGDALGQWNLGGTVSATWFGAGAGGDDTTALDLAFRACSNVLHLPKGAYNISGTVTAPRTLRIVGLECQAKYSTSPADGSVISCTSGAVIRLTGDDVELDGLTFYYPGQTYNGSTAPVAFSPTVICVADGSKITNVLFYNSYIGVICGGHKCIVRNCRGQFLNYGISLANDTVVRDCVFDAVWAARGTTAGDNLEIKYLSVLTNGGDAAVVEDCQFRFGHVFATANYRNCLFNCENIDTFVASSRTSGAHGHCLGGSTKDCTFYGSGAYGCYAIADLRHDGTLFAGPYFGCKYTDLYFVEFVNTRLGTTDAYTTQFAACPIPSTAFTNSDTKYAADTYPQGGCRNAEMFNLAGGSTVVKHLAGANGYADSAILNSAPVYGYWGGTTAGEVTTVAPGNTAVQNTIVGAPAGVYYGLDTTGITRAVHKGFMVWAVFEAVSTPIGAIIDLAMYPFATIDLSDPANDYRKLISNVYLPERALKGGRLGFLFSYWCGYPIWAYDPLFIFGTNRNYPSFQMLFSGPTDTADIRCNQATFGIGDGSSNCHALFSEQPSRASISENLYFDGISPTTIAGLDPEHHGGDGYWTTRCYETSLPSPFPTVPKFEGGPRTGDVYLIHSSDPITLRKVP